MTVILPGIDRLQRNLDQVNYEKAVKYACGVAFLTPLLKAWNSGKNIPGANLKSYSDGYKTYKTTTLKRSSIPNLNVSGEFHRSHEVRKQGDLFIVGPSSRGHKGNLSNLELGRYLLDVRSNIYAVGNEAIYNFRKLFTNYLMGKAR